MDKIIITDLTVNGVIGVKSPERDAPQNMLVNVILYADLKAIGENDSVEDLINYSTVSRMITAEVANTQFYTVEGLATHLAKRILEGFDVRKVKVRVEKPNYVTNTVRVGVELTRRRKELAN